MNDEKCPHCGTGQADRLEYGCGTKTYGHIRGEECYEAEIEKLREKKAEGLTWDRNPMTFEQTAQGVAGLYWINTHRNGVELWCDEDLLMNGFDDDDSAKAHAEELHQQAWLELRERWDKK